VELAVHLASFIFEKRPTDRKDGEKIADFDGTLFRTSEGWDKNDAEGHPASALSETFRHRDLPLQTAFELVESGRAYLQFRIQETTGDPSTPFPIGKV